MPRPPAGFRRERHANRHLKPPEEMARLFVAPLPTLPALTFLGTAETVVSASMVRNQVAAMKAGELVLLQGARHEILMERPEIQAEVWSHIDRFLAAPPTGPDARPLPPT